MAIADRVQKADVMFLTSHVFHRVQSERLRMAMWFTIRFLVASFQPILSLPGNVQYLGSMVGLWLGCTRSALTF